eukprot:CAMPEP_0116134562 /NCGR_PEP_ID=MMETSP0329-20121206/10713_1 /TAXON_ID=697910 /ORGANISM="Pseudo-nitzschia arenysensis, Strain B593" /LENGTH=57 /DNA_ID=CAMNT_0003629283 /DNA_START=133 /DNA_END=303 /DNA_ORIENTATION=+
MTDESDEDIDPFPKFVNKPISDGMVVIGLKTMRVTVKDDHLKARIKSVSVIVDLVKV